MIMLCAKKKHIVPTKNHMKAGYALAKSIKLLFAFSAGAFLLISPTVAPFRFCDFSPIISAGDRSESNGFLQTTFVFVHEHICAFENIGKALVETKLKGS